MVLENFFGQKVLKTRDVGTERKLPVLHGCGDANPHSLYPIGKNKTTKYIEHFLSGNRGLPFDLPTELHSLHNGGTKMGSS